MANTYDFYKPKLDSEYPEVDGPLTITTYFQALDQSYARYREKTQKAKKLQSLHATANGHPNGNGAAANAVHPGGLLESFDYSLFHSPYGKLVQKSHARLVSVSPRRKF